MQWSFLATRPTSYSPFAPGSWLQVLPQPLPHSVDSGVSTVDEVPSAFRHRITPGMASRFMAQKKKTHKWRRSHLGERGGNWSERVVSSLDEAKRNPGRYVMRGRNPGFHAIPSGLQGWAIREVPENTAGQASSGTRQNEGGHLYSPYYALRLTSSALSSYATRSQPRDTPPNDRAACRRRARGSSGSSCRRTRAGLDCRPA